MLFFLIFALASADYIVAEKDKTKGLYIVYPLDVCMGGNTGSYKYIKDGTVGKKATYTTNDCSGTETKVDLPATEKLEANMPGHVAYSQAGAKDDCSDHKEWPFAILYTDVCINITTTKDGQQVTIQGKYEVNASQVIIRAYNGTNCENKTNETANFIECDKCSDKTQTYCKKYEGYVKPEPPSVANATYVVIEQGKGMVVVSPFDVCVKNETASYKYIKEGNVAKKLTYTTVDCKGTETKVDLPATEKPVEKLPEHVAYSQEGNKDDCSDHKNMPAAALFTKGCFKAEEGSAYMSYIVEGTKVYGNGYTDDKCTVAAPGNVKEEMSQCDKCDKKGQTYCKVYEGYVKPADPVTPPKPDNGNAFTAILMAVFFLFFLF